MGDITRLGFLRHYRGGPNAHVIQVRAGQVRRAGAGQSFWFRALSAALSEVPTDDRELPLLFHARTQDFQDVTVQLTVGYRFTDPDRAARRLDFSVDPDRGGWRGQPLDQVALLLTELAQQHALELLAATSLHHAVAGGADAVRSRVADGLREDPRLDDLGVAVVGVRVVAVRAEPDLERAMQTPAREQVQQEADRATYERRALAVERERAISENELQSRIELAVREERLVTQEGANARRRTTETAAAQRIDAQAQAEHERLRADSRAEAVRAVGIAEAEVSQARMAVYQNVDPRVLLALAAREAAGNLPQIGALTLTPDLLTGLLSQLARPAAVGAPDRSAAPAPDRERDGDRR